MQKFESFCTNSEIAEKAEKVQCTIFLHVAGKDATKVCNTVVFEDDDMYKIEAMKRKFLDYCELRKKKIAINLTQFPRGLKEEQRS